MRAIVAAMSVASGVHRGVRSLRYCYQTMTRSYGEFARKIDGKVGGGVTGKAALERASADEASPLLRDVLECNLTWIIDLVYVL